MKHFLFISFISFIVCFNLSADQHRVESGNKNIPFGGGDGSEENPYRISTKDHLMELSDSIKCYETLGVNRTLDKHYILTQNIENVDFVIGFDFDFDAMINNKYSFAGYFNGNSRTITLALDSTTDSYMVALFSYSTGIINNLTIGGFVEASEKVLIVTGITCINGGTVTNCINDANISGYKNVSGMVGINFGYITYCTNNGNVRGLEKPSIDTEPSGKTMGMETEP